MRPKKIYLICPVHNRLELTKRFLENAPTFIPGYNLIFVIVDDGSTDGTSEWIRRHFPRIIILEGDGNLWWSGAMNMGAEHALKDGAEYVLVINNDNSFNAESIFKLVNFAEEKKFKIIGSKVLDLYGHQNWLGGYFDRSKGNFGLYAEPKESTADYYEVDWLPGMGTLIHRSVFEKIGYWNSKDFPQSYGDADFILRAKKIGISAYVYLESVIWNDTRFTGELHGNSLRGLLRSFNTIHSYYNVPIDLKFFRYHEVNYLLIARILSCKYFKYIGGFIKHKIRNIFMRNNGAKT